MDARWASVLLRTAKSYPQQFTNPTGVPLIMHITATMASFVEARDSMKERKDEREHVRTS